MAGLDAPNDGATLRRAYRPQEKGAERKAQDSQQRGQGHHRFQLLIATGKGGALDRTLPRVASTDLRRFVQVTVTRSRRGGGIRRRGFMVTVIRRGRKKTRRTVLSRVPRGKSNLSTVTLLFYSGTVFTSVRCTLLFILLATSMLHHAIGRDGEHYHGAPLPPAGRVLPSSLEEARERERLADVGGAVPRRAQSPSAVSAGNSARQPRAPVCWLLLRAGFFVPASQSTKIAVEGARLFVGTDRAALAGG
jgi:hypothetical protein